MLFKRHENSAYEKDGSGFLKLNCMAAIRLYSGQSKTPVGVMVTVVIRRTSVYVIVADTDWPGQELRCFDKVLIDRKRSCMMGHGRSYERSKMVMEDL